MPVFFWLAYFKLTLSIRQISSGNTARNSTPTSELVLLAYYITAINIEEAFHARHVGVGSPNPAGSPKPAGESPIPHEPFKGMVLTDTFNLNKRNKGPTLFPKEWLPNNSPIEVIVGNPPWSAGQQRTTDDNPQRGLPRT